MQCYLALCYNAEKHFLTNTQVYGDTPEEAALSASLKISQTVYIEIDGKVFKVT